MVDNMYNRIIVQYTLGVLGEALLPRWTFVVLGSWVYSLLTNTKAGYYGPEWDNVFPGALALTYTTNKTNLPQSRALQKPRWVNSWATNMGICARE